ncbi:MAG: hypothetical protein AABW81_03435 [Nanoarchaeota archaeon]
MPKKEKSDIEELKKGYLKIQKKYNLPDFQILNEEFQIESIADSETEILIREVRKIMAGKFSNYLRFIEILIHPINAPMSALSIVKLLTSEDKRRLTESYKKLTRIEVDIIEVDTDFSEKKEAEFIKNSYKSWLEIKQDVLYVVESIKSSWNNKSDKSRIDYFG